MNRTTIAQAGDLPGAPAPGFPTNLWRAWVDFWFKPTDAVGLHVIRVFSGVLFLAWLLGFAGQQEAFLGLQGWFDRQAYLEASRIQGGAPVPIGWSILYLCGTNAMALNLVYWTSVAVVGLFTLGLWTRLTGILNYLVVASFIATPSIVYDADALLVMLAVYLAFGYLLTGLRNQRQSNLERWLGSRRGGILAWWSKGSEPESYRSIGANVALRLLQVNFAILVCVSGLHKLQSGDWWQGTALWYSLYPPFETTIEDVRSVMPKVSTYLVLLSLAAYITLAWQIFFPLFAWRRAWRLILLGGGVVGWLGTAFIYELPVFGPAMLIGCCSYLTAAEWQALKNLAPRWTRLRSQAGIQTDEFTAEAGGTRNDKAVAANARRR